MHNVQFRNRFQHYCNKILLQDPQYSPFQSRPALNVPLKPHNMLCGLQISHIHHACRTGSGHCTSGKGRDAWDDEFQNGGNTNQNNGGNTDYQLLVVLSLHCSQKETASRFRHTHLGLLSNLSILSTVERG